MSESDDALLKRHVLDLARESLTAFRVLVIHGARQVGKTTLAVELGRELGAEFVTLDNIRRADALDGLVRYFAATTGQELVLSKAPERLRIDRSTVAGYEPWLETVFLIHRLPAWSRNLAAKVVRRPKIYVSDSGLGASLLGKTPTRCAGRPIPRPDRCSRPSWSANCASSSVGARSVPGCTTSGIEVGRKWT